MQDEEWKVTHDCQHHANIYSGLYFSNISNQYKLQKEVNLEQLNDIWNKIIWPNFHNHGFQGIPPSMPGVPDDSIIRLCCVGALIVHPIQVCRVTPSGRAKENRTVRRKDRIRNFILLRNGKTFRQWLLLFLRNTSFPQTWNFYTNKGHCLSKWVLVPPQTIPDPLGVCWKISISVLSSFLW